MLTFMNSKLTKMAGKDKQNHIFLKQVNRMKFPVHTHIQYIFYFIIYLHIYNIIYNIFYI